MTEEIIAQIDMNLYDISMQLLHIGTIIGNLKSTSPETDKVFNIAKEAYSDIMTLCYNIGQLQSHIK